jgi:transcription antitermination factor NusA-like protein
LSVVVGRRGSKIREIREKHAIKIDVVESIDNIVNLTLNGDRIECLLAKNEIIQLSNDHSDLESCQINVPNYLHRFLIGPSGSIINEIVNNLGGPHKIQVKFPKSPDNGDLILIHANNEISELVKVALYKSLEESCGETKGCLEIDKASIKEDIAISKSELSFISGRQKQNFVQMMKSYNVTIRIEELENVTMLYVLGNEGMQSNVSSCLQEIKVFLNLTIFQDKMRVTEKIPIPEDIVKSFIVEGKLNEMHKSFMPIFKKVKIQGVHAEIIDNMILMRGESTKLLSSTSLITSHFKQLVI